MKRGPKPDLPSTKLNRGTYRPYRDRARIEVIGPDALPMQPDWLTALGELVWQDNIGRIAQNRLATELDSTMFATFCNLQGANNAAWQDGIAPPAAHLMEARRMAEQFGLFGAKSRVKTGDDGRSIAPTNPFARNGVRR